MKKKIVIFSLIAALFVAVAVGIFVSKDSVRRIAPDAEYSFSNPDKNQAQADPGMTVDGVFSEDIYEKNTWVYLHNANGGNTVDIAMTSWFGEKGIYFAYEVRENTPIYVNMDRPTWMNSCIEMYLVPSDVQSMPTENIFEIDLLPNGHLLFKRPNAAGGWSDVATTGDKMAILGANPYGGPVNTESCTGYDLELFIPYDYLTYLGVNAENVKSGHVNVNPCHITSYNEDGTDGSVDRFWYSFGKQLGGDGWNDVNRYFQFNQDGAMHTVPNGFIGEHCTVIGRPTAVPGLGTTVSVTPDAGYAISSLVCNDKEMLPYADFREDGSVVMTLDAQNRGMYFSAKAEPVSLGNKTLTGKVEIQNIFGDKPVDISASYADQSGEHKLELDGQGGFILSDVPQGLYTIRVKKDGYLKTERTVYLDQDRDMVIDLKFDLLETENGNCWNDSQVNSGFLTKINGTGAVLTKEAYGDFYIEANFPYSEMLAQEFPGDDYYQQRMGLRIKFDDGKYWHVDLLRQNDGNFVLQYGKILGEDSLYNWVVPHTLTADQVASYKSEQGIKLGLLRLGNTAWVYLDNKCVATAKLGAQGKCKAQLGFESFVSNRKVMTVPVRMDISNPGQMELVDLGSVGAKVSLASGSKVGGNATLQITPRTQSGAKLLSVLVNGVEMVQNAVKTGSGYSVTISGNTEKILSVKVIYAKPQPMDAIIDTLDSNCNGVSVRLVQDGQVVSTTTANAGKATFVNVPQGVYSFQANVFGVWTHVASVTLLAENRVEADINTIFETPELVNYTGNIAFTGKSGKHYSIAADISGDAWFAMKLQVDKAKLEAVSANKENVRLGYRLFFGGDSGNYLWENEYEITLKYNAGGWIFEQMNTWQSFPLTPDAMDALTGQGLYLALHRDEVGVITLHYGVNPGQLIMGQNTVRWEVKTDKQLQNITRFGAGFWSEKGSDYAATVTGLTYGESLEAIFGDLTVGGTVQLYGHKAGKTEALANQTVTLGEQTFTTDDAGVLTYRLMPGQYNLSVAGYYPSQILVETEQNTQLTLEYERFTVLTGWDAELHDLTQVNNDPAFMTIGKDMQEQTPAGTLNILSTDSYGDVTAKLWVRKANSLHSAHNQGIWLRFADGKYMILTHEDEKLLYMKDLWHLISINEASHTISTQLPEEILNKWNTEGYELGLMRKGNSLFVTADGQLYDKFTLPAQYADQTVQAGFFAYDSAGGATWKFSMEGAAQEFTNTAISGDVFVENGTVLRLLQEGTVIRTVSFQNSQVQLQGLSDGIYDAQMRIFGVWCNLGSVELRQGETAVLPVAQLFENPNFTDFDGNIPYPGGNNHCSIATNIEGDAWFAMKVQVDKASLESNAANGNNVRLGYRLFFGGESGNYLWENEYEITLKYTGSGWIMEQMNTWEGWDRQIPWEIIDALVGDGVYLALHRDSNSGVLTLYYGADIQTVLAKTYSVQYTQGAWKHTDPITRFGAGFWAENGADYEATITNLRYGATLEEALSKP